MKVKQKPRIQRWREPDAKDVLVARYTEAADLGKRFRREVEAAANVVTSTQLNPSLLLWRTDPKADVEGLQIFVDQLSFWIKALQAAVNCAPERFLPVAGSRALWPVLSSPSSKVAK